MAGAPPVHLPLVADAEKWADPELVFLALDGWQSAVLVALAKAQVLCKPAAALFAARSFVGREPADAAVELERQAAQLAPPEPSEWCWLQVLGPQEHSRPGRPRGEPRASLEYWAAAQR